MGWFKIIFEALLYTATLFVAHDLWLNKHIIEPAMAQGQKSAFFMGFVYYAFCLSVAVFLVHKLMV